MVEKIDQKLSKNILLVMFVHSQKFEYETLFINCLFKIVRNQPTQLTKTDGKILIMELNLGTCNFWANI